MPDETQEKQEYKINCSPGPDAPDTICEQLAELERATESLAMEHAKAAPRVLKLRTRWAYVTLLLIGILTWALTIWSWITTGVSPDWQHHGPSLILCIALGLMSSEHLRWFWLIEKTVKSAKPLRQKIRLRLDQSGRLLAEMFDHLFIVSRWNNILSRSELASFASGPSFDADVYLDPRTHKPVAIFVNGSFLILAARSEMLPRGPLPH